MHLSLLSLVALSTLAVANTLSSTPQAPELEWLFTANLDARSSTAPLLPGPLGTRVDVPITGGNFTGRDGLIGTIRSDSHDWAILDSNTGLAFADAHWSITLPATKSTNGQKGVVYVKSTGNSAPSLEDGTFILHLRMVLETGVPEYYWLNNVLAIGNLEIRNINNVLDPTRTEIENVNIKAFSLKSAWKSTDKVFTCLYDPREGCPNFVAESSESVAAKHPEL